MKKSNGIIHWRSLSGEILAETDLSGNNLREYIYFAGRRVARRDANGTVYYFLQDHLGSTRIIANASGSVVRDVDYYAHGTEKLVSGTVDDPHKFAGMYFDSESGLYYTWFRMYSPSLGRWLAPDPVAGDVETPGSLNRYTYVLNNPVNFVDPLGLFATPCFGYCPPVAPPSPPYGPSPDPAGYEPPNPYGDTGGCTAPDGQCGGRPGSGGGGGQPTPKPKTGPTEEQTKILNEALQNALERLENVDCARLFGEGAEEELKRTRHAYAKLGAPKVDSRGQVSAVGAATIGSPVRNVNGATPGPATVYINSQGPFMNQTVFVPGKSQPVTLDWGTGLRGADFRALTLLHELGHVTGRFGHDAAFPAAAALNRAYTNLVLSHCF